MHFETQMLDPPWNRTAGLLVLCDFQTKRQQSISELLKECGVRGTCLPRERWAIEVNELDKGLVFGSQPRKFDLAPRSLQLPIKVDLGGLQR